MNMPPKRRALAYLLASFLAGLVAGMVAGGLAGRTLGADRLARPPAPEAMAASVKQRLQQDLRLSPEQARQVAPIVDHFVQQLQVVHSNTVEQSVLAIRQMHRDVEAVLTPDQKRQFSEVQERREAEFRRVARPPSQ